MRWEPLLIILLLAGLTGLFILATHYRKYWLTWLVWDYLTSLGATRFYGHCRLHYRSWAWSS